MCWLVAANITVSTALGLRLQPNPSILAAAMILRPTVRALAITEKSPSLTSLARARQVPVFSRGPRAWRAEMQPAMPMGHEAGRLPLHRQLPIWDPAADAARERLRKL